MNLGTRLGCLTVVVVTATGVVPAAPADVLNLSGLGQVLDLTLTTGNLWQPLNNDKMVELCRDHDGCTLRLKIDGPDGIVSTVETVYLSGYSLKFTTTTTVNGEPPPPFIDGDGTVVALAQVVTEDDDGIAGCAVTDEDDFDKLPVDLGEGFGMRFVVQGKIVPPPPEAQETLDPPPSPIGIWVCILHIDD